MVYCLNLFVVPVPQTNIVIYQEWCVFISEDYGEYTFVPGSLMCAFGGKQEQVGNVHVMKTANGVCIKGNAVFKCRRQFICHDGDIFLRSEGIAKTEANEFDIVFLYKFQDIAYCIVHGYNHSIAFWIVNEGAKQNSVGENVSTYPDRHVATRFDDSGVFLDTKRIFP